MSDSITDYRSTMRKEFQQRIDKLQQRLQKENLDGALFFHTEEIYYFTGTGVNSILLIPSYQEPILLVRINVVQGKKDGFISDVRASNGLGSLQEVISEMFGKKKIMLGLSFDVTTLTFFHNLNKFLGNVNFIDIQPIIWSLRQIKSPWEISQIKEAAKISYTGFEKGIKLLHEGITEIEFQKSIEQITYAYGDEGNMVQRGSNNRLSFGVVAFGENTSVISGHWMTMTSIGRSAIRPYGAGNYRLSHGDIVIIDKGTVYQGYHADEARTFVFGKASERRKDLHKILNEILDTTINEIRPGVAILDVYLKAEKVALSFGLKENFMGLDQYGFRYVGHGVGLEIDEPPLISAYNKNILKPGMVLAVEPKLIFKNDFGLTMEETVVVTESGCDVITTFPRDAFEI